MSDLLLEYVENINFQIVTQSELTSSKLENLESKDGLVIETDTTDLWIMRELSIHNILGVNIVMESTNNFSIMDSFGIKIWSGDSESIIEYVEGFLTEDIIV